MSVVTANPNSAFTRLKSSNPCRIEIPRLEPREVRLALSKLDLKMNGKRLERGASVLHTSITRSADSIMHGPKMNFNGFIMDNCMSESDYCKWKRGPLRSRRQKHLESGPRV